MKLGKIGLVWVVPVWTIVWLTDWLIWLEVEDCVWVELWLIWVELEETVWILLLLLWLTIWVEFWLELPGIEIDICGRVGAHIDENWFIDWFPKDWVKDWFANIQPPVEVLVELGGFIKAFWTTLCVLFVKEKLVPCVLKKVLWRLPVVKEKLAPWALGAIPNARVAVAITAEKMRVSFWDELVVLCLFMASVSKGLICL